MSMPVDHPSLVAMRESLQCQGCGGVLSCYCAGFDQVLAEWREMLAELQSGQVKFLTWEGIK